MKQLLNWFRLRRMESDLDRELRYHLDRRVNDLMTAGLAEPEARRQAAYDVGGLSRVREEVRDVWLTRWLRDFAYDLRFSARSFLRNPSFSATAVLSLALGIGATSAVYSLVDQVILHALPVRDAEQLVLVDWKGDGASTNAFGSYNLMPYPFCRDLQQQDRIFECVLCRAETTVNLSTGGDATPAAAELVSGTYFTVLGVRPALGRLFSNDDDRTPGTNPVVVLSYDFWQTQLAGDAGVVGRKLLINKHPMTVIGVAAAGFQGIDVGSVPVLWIPATMSAEAIPGFRDMLSRRTFWMQVLGRLRPDVTLAEARAGVQPWFKAMLEEDMRRAGFPNLSSERRQRYLTSSLELTPAAQGHSPLRRRLSAPLWVLLAGTAVLLGLACLNVAGLFLARATARAREISTRFALGASGGRIGRQLLADGILVALAGGLLGIALAPAAMRALIAFLPRNPAAYGLRADVDLRLLLIAVALSVMTGMMAALAPALQAGRGSAVLSLRERGGTGSGLRLRRAIVTMQIAFTLILVIGAALFVRTLTGLLAKGPGFDTSSLISFGIDPLRSGYTRPEAARLIRRLEDEIRVSPITKASAIAQFRLLEGGSQNNWMTIQSDQRLVTDRVVHLNTVTNGFFATLGARMVAGRNFAVSDAIQQKEPGKRVTIVNENFVKRYFGDRNPLGAHIGVGNGPDTKTDIEIIGVVANFSYRGVREEVEHAYFPMSMGTDVYEGGNFFVRVHGQPEAAFASIRTILRNADPALPVSFRTLDEMVSRSLNTERMLAAISGSFGVLALLLSLVGLYGVMSFVVTQRTREIGIRVALGATRLATVWLVVRDAMMMITAGIVIALPCVWVLGRLIESQLYDVKPTDPGMIAVAILILGAAALGAALVPARRASALNPTEALRFE